MYMYLLPSEPSEVSLVVDGKTDQCSRGEDINFNHIGFSVYGQVNIKGSLFYTSAQLHMLCCNIECISVCHDCVMNVSLHAHMLGVKRWL